jgi:FixJ family two-component response regulator
MTLYRFQINGTENSLQRNLQAVPHKGIQRELVAVTPDTRRAIWDMLYKHGKTPQKIARDLKVSQQAITATIRARVSEEIDKAVQADRLRRGPQPPWGGQRRAA